MCRPTRRRKALEKDLTPKLSEFPVAGLYNHLGNLAMAQGEADRALGYFYTGISSDSEHIPPDGKLRVYRSRTGGNEWEPLTKGLPQRDCYVNILRDASSVDTLDKCGVYFGTTGGQVYASADAGDNWTAVVRDLPPVLSVEVQTLP